MAFAKENTANVIGLAIDNNVFMMYECDGLRSYILKNSFSFY